MKLNAWVEKQQLTDCGMLEGLPAAFPFLSWNFSEELSEKLAGFGWCHGRTRSWTQLEHRSFAVI